MKYDVFVLLCACVVNKQLWRAQQALNAVLQVSSNGCTCMQVCACSGVTPSGFCCLLTICSVISMHGDTMLCL